MGKTKIQWCDEVWNPVTGCTPVSEGCRNCYARRMAQRLRGRYGYPKDDPFKVTLHPLRLDEPMGWRKPRKIFVCSMADPFHKDVPFDYLEKMHRFMWHAQQHTFLLLTKRPGIAREFHDYIRAKPFTFLTEQGKYWPLPNVWLGVSVENQETANERIPMLVEIDAALHFISYEPALGPADLEKYLLACDDCGNRGSAALFGNRPGSGHNLCQDACIKRGESPALDWVILGGESGPGARPMDVQWARTIRDQCVEAGVPFFFKQWGEWAPSKTQPEFIHRRDFSDIGFFNESGNFQNGVCSHAQHMIRVGKKKAGRLLDGREWNEFPKGEGHE